MEICEILVYCTEVTPRKPAVHKDITPDNILLDRDNHARLSDFGIATARDLIPHYEGQNLAGWGKPPYMSPNRLASQAGSDNDPRDDIFSLGVVMFEMLANTVP